MTPYGWSGARGDARERVQASGAEGVRFGWKKEVFMAVGFKVIPSLKFPRHGFKVIPSLKFPRQQETQDFRHIAPSAKFSFSLFSFSAATHLAVRPLFHARHGKHHAF
jgi:hypothetical protein